MSTVVVGDRYRHMLDIFMSTYNRFDQMPQMLVVSEYPEKIQHQNILTTNIGDNPTHVNNDFNMCLKRLAFQHAIDRGYEKIIFIDIDRTIESWNWEKIFNVTKPGIGTNWLRSYKPSRAATKNTKALKYQTILNGFNNEEYYNQKYPVFGESLNIMHQPKQTIQQFINTWAKCGEYIKESTCTPRHINVEMGVSLVLSGIEIYKFPEPVETVFGGDIFKHYAYGKKSELFKLNKK